MTANEETKVAQMVDGYERKIRELEANSVPFEVFSEPCEHRQHKPTEPTYCDKNYELCTKQNCLLIPKGE
jgi:hypothetical protein